MLKKLRLSSQRGAMFGLDARIALAIIGALSLVTGTTMFMTIPQVQSKSLVKDIEAYKTAVEGMQYDLRQSIHSAVTTGGVLNTKAFQALNDPTLLVAAAQPRWLGPYLKARQGDASTHENYGQMHLIRAEKEDPTDETCAPCFYWLQIDDAPVNTFNEVNQLIDGTEATPQVSGKARFAAAAGVDPDRLYVRLGKTL